jgi:hypothetical protein
MRLYVTTNKPIQSLIRQKTYRTAIQNRTLVLLSLTHPLTNHAQATHKNLWIGFSTHIVDAVDDQTCALHTLTTEQISLLYTQSTQVDQVQFEPGTGEHILLEDLRLHSFETLISGIQAEPTQNGADHLIAAEETDPLLRVQIVEETAEGNQQPPKPNGGNPVKPVFGEAVSSVKKRIGKRIGKLIEGAKNIWDEIIK